MDFETEIEYSLDKDVTKIRSHFPTSLIGNQCSWSSSSSLDNHGVENLLDGRNDTYWQLNYYFIILNFYTRSEGKQPHELFIHLKKICKVKRIEFYLNKDLDESYSPEKVYLYSGSGYNDLKKIAMSTFGKTLGWVRANLTKKKYISANIIKISIASCHSNGKDTRIRQIKLYGVKDNEKEHEKYKNKYLKMYSGMR